VKALFLANQDWYFLLHWMDRARALRECGVEVVVAAPPGERTAEIEAAGLRFAPIPLSRKGMQPLAELRAIRQIKALLLQEEPDLVHSLTIKPNLYGALAIRRAERRHGRSIPLAASVTGMGFLFGRASPPVRIVRWIALALYRRASRLERVRFLFENPDDRSELVARGIIRAEQGVLIPGAGVDLELFRPAPEPETPPVRFLFAGRLLREKGLPELAAAGRILRERGLAAEILAAGILDPGAPGAISAEQLRIWEGEGALRYLGEKRPEEVAQLLEQCHAAVLPTSYREGVPRFLIEAAAAGRPGVTTDAPGCREIVRREETGLLIPPQNAVALADALERLIGDADLRRRLGRSARLRAEAGFSREAVRDATFAVYRDLLPEQADRFK